MLVAVSAVVVALLGREGIAAMYRARSQNRALDSGTLVTVTKAVQEVYGTIAGDLRVELDRVQDEHAKCRSELSALRIEVGDLRARVGILEP